MLQHTNSRTHNICCISCTSSCCQRPLNYYGGCFLFLFVCSLRTRKHFVMVIALFLALLRALKVHTTPNFSTFFLYFLKLNIGQKQWAELKVCSKFDLFAFEIYIHSLPVIISTLSRGPIITWYCFMASQRYVFLQRNKVEMRVKSSGGSRRASQYSISISLVYPTLLRSTWLWLIHFFVFQRDFLYGPLAFLWLTSYIFTGQVLNFDIVNLLSYGQVLT